MPVPDSVENKENVDGRPIDKHEGDTAGKIFNDPTDIVKEKERGPALGVAKDSLDTPVEKNAQLVDKAKKLKDYFEHKEQLRKTGKDVNRPLSTIQVIYTQIATNS